MKLDRFAPIDQATPSVLAKAVSIFSNPYVLIFLILPHAKQE